MFFKEFNHFFRESANNVNSQKLDEELEKIRKVKSQKFSEELDKIRKANAFDDSMWEIEGVDDAIFTTKLSTCVDCELKKCYDTWKRIPISLWSEKRLGVDVIKDPNDGYFGTKTPDLFYFLLDEIVLSCTNIIWTINSFNNLPDDRKAIHEGTPFDHDELLQFASEIKDLASSLKENKLFREPCTDNRLLTDDEIKLISDVHEAGNLFCSFVRYWFNKYQPWSSRYL